MKWLLLVTALGFIIYNSFSLMPELTQINPGELNNDLVGIWQDGQFDPPVWGYTLDLKADGTFTYSYFDDQVNEDVNGNWHAKDNKLILDYESDSIKELEKELKFSSGKIYRYRTPEGEFDEDVYLIKQTDSGLVAE